jgi:hypothetical protein
MKQADHSNPNLPTGHSFVVLLHSSMTAFVEILGPGQMQNIFVKRNVGRQIDWHVEGFLILSNV